MSGESVTDYKEVTDSEKNTIANKDAQWEAPSEDFIAQAEAAGAVYNRSTGFFELNGLVDITEKDMRNCLLWGCFADFQYLASSPTYLSSDVVRLRTTIPSITVTQMQFPQMGWLPGGLEVIRFSVPTNSSAKPVFLMDGYNPIFKGEKLRRIEDRLEPTRPLSIGDYNNGITAPLLEVLNIHNLKYNLNIRYLPSLSLSSLQYMVDKAANTSPITVTLHPDVYAHITDELFAQAAEKQINFATTE